ncbi:MAG: hypothetical protein E6Q28_13075 [Afipia sp.]|jgi:hypothetical protein|nr:MAG: hypothetical protein E6Q28_13075 [Afipia sp.]
MFKVAHKTENMAGPSYLCTHGEFATPHRLNTLKARTFKTEAGARRAAAKWNVVYEDYAYVEAA